MAEIDLKKEIEYRLNILVRKGLDIEQCVWSDSDIL